MNLVHASFNSEAVGPSYDNFYEKHNEYEHIFEKLYEYFEANHKDLLNSLQSEYSDDLISSIKSALDKFKGAS